MLERTHRTRQTLQRFDIGRNRRPHPDWSIAVPALVRSGAPWRSRMSERRGWGCATARPQLRATDLRRSASPFESRSGAGRSGPTALRLRTLQARAELGREGAMRMLREGSGCEPSELSLLAEHTSHGRPSVGCTGEAVTSAADIEDEQAHRRSASRAQRMSSIDTLLPVVLARSCARASTSSTEGLPASSTSSDARYSCSERPERAARAASSSRTSSGTLRIVSATMPAQ